MKTLGERLKYAREQRRYTQVEVAKKLDITNGAISGYERNYRDPDTDTLNKMATLYDVTPNWLLGRNEKESEYSLPESVYEHVIKEAEEKYGVNLRDDPVVNATLRELILGIAKSKQ